MTSLAKNSCRVGKNDRLFGSSGSCYGCGQPIPASELVMRAQTSVYHLKCFTCCTCHSPLNTGDRYGIVQGSLVCEQDYPKVVKGLAPLPNRTSHKSDRSSPVSADSGGNQSARSDTQARSWSAPALNQGIAPPAVSRETLRLVQHWSERSQMGRCRV
ncbi:LIM domain transcription factor LMO4.2 [Elysia marginata]|uniref:LIM domain transcription factor LMO4.2 n=1 Tax=Elysia marginata TaxID=1093978 RepID=A0AAV4IHD9_9GAST|nr:LIM domain transcription factor LMO4.2 [Elysia marginata]